MIVIKDGRARGKKMNYRNKKMIITINVAKLSEKIFFKPAKQWDVNASDE